MLKILPHSHSTDKLQLVARIFPGANFVWDVSVWIKEWMRSIFITICTVPLDLQFARLVYALTIMLMAVVPWTCFASFSAARSLRSSCRVRQQTSSKHLPQDVGSLRACKQGGVHSISDCAEEFMEEQSGRVEAIRYLLLLYLGGSAALWLNLLPQRAAALAMHTVFIIVGVLAMLDIHCDVNRVAVLRDVTSIRPEGCRVCVSVVPFIVLSWMAAHGTFFGTGHFSEFAGIQWPSAFVGFQDSNPMWRSAMLIAINTFTPQAMVAVVVAVMLLIAYSSVLVVLRNDAKKLRQAESRLVNARVMESSTCSCFIRITSVHVQIWQLCCKLQLEYVPVTSSGRPEDIPRVNSSCEYPRCDLGDARAVADIDSWCIWRLIKSIVFLDASSCMILLTSEIGLLHRWSKPKLMRQAVHVMYMLSTTFVSFVLAAALFGASSSVFIHRRHLMIWALFAPKWLFEVCLCFVAGVSVVWVSWVLQYSGCVQGA